MLGRGLSATRRRVPPTPHPRVPLVPELPDGRVDLPGVPRAVPPDQEERRQERRVEARVDAVALRLEVLLVEILVGARVTAAGSWRRFGEIGGGGERGACGVAGSLQPAAAAHTMRTTPSYVWMTLSISPAVMPAVGSGGATAVQLVVSDSRGARAQPHDAGAVGAPSSLSASRTRFGRSSFGTRRPKCACCGTPRARSAPTNRR